MRNDALLTYTPDNGHVELFLNNIKTEEQKLEVLETLEELINKIVV